MSTNPLNLGFRFFLEISMLGILGYWGWHLKEGWPSYLAALGIPITAAVLWGVFRIPNDPKPAPVRIPGIVRILLEFGLFGFATWALYDLQAGNLGLILGLIVFFHYLISYDRTWAMLRNRPYTGFVK
jgi:hypothetical protein